MIRRPGAPLALALLTAALARGAHADNWLQLRRDANRTGASNDRIPPPLTEIWHLNANGDAVWEGRLYSVEARLSRRFLTCTEVRTGVRLWERPLEGSSDVLNTDVPVSVNANGLVYLYDWERVPHTINESETTILPDGTPRSRYIYASHTHYFLRRFDGRTGQPLEFYPPGRVEAEPASRVYLGDGLRGTPREPTTTALLMRPGPPLLTGDRLTALCAEDLQVQWQPGSPARYQLFSHLLPGQPAPGTRAEFILYPPVSAQQGIAISGFGDRRFLALMDGGDVLWHRDFPWLPGYTASEKANLFLHMQGQGPDGIVGIDSATGEFRWTYAPKGLPPVLARVNGTAAGSYSASGPQGLRSGTSFQTASAIKGIRNWLPEEIVLKDNRVFGQVLGQVVALDQATGQPIWTQFPGERLGMSSLVGTQDHLMVAAYSHDPKRASDRLCALVPGTGKVEWSMPVRSVGRLMVGDGILFMHANGLSAYAPAERTFHLAVDSNRRDDYRLDLETAAPEAAPEAAENPLAELGPKPAPSKEEQVKKEKALADASLLRLRWNEPVETLLKKARDRRALAPNVPLVLVLEWLDPARATVLGSPERDRSIPQLAAFTALCERLAREIQPAHFEIATDLNVYLTRYPERLERVGELVDAARDAVHKGAPNTRVVVSLNAEVLSSRYGRGTYLPFGKLELPRESQAPRHLSLARRADEVGFTSRPEAGFTAAEQLPGDYFTAWKRLLADQPLLITDLATLRDPKANNPDLAQSAFVKRLVQLCYWLDAKIVAYPGVDAPPAPADPKLATPGLREGEKPRSALAFWKDPLAWKRVPTLTSVAARREW